MVAGDLVGQRLVGLEVLHYAVSANGIVQDVRQIRIVDCRACGFRKPTGALAGSLHLRAGSAPLACPQESEPWRSAPDPIDSQVTSSDRGCGESNIGNACSEK